jgi:hexosaminidase
VVLPAVDITDYPRFDYRGVLLDVGRHFFSVAFIKDYLDLIAQYKINRFQLHLTDDQGWRIEIKKYPRLTEMSSQSGEPSEEENVDPFARGYYTQEQIKDIVAYAQARFITVIPEIEMPGHSGGCPGRVPGTGMYTCSGRGEQRRQCSQRRFLSQRGDFLFPAKRPE